MRKLRVVAFSPLLLAVLSGVFLLALAYGVFRSLTPRRPQQTATRPVRQVEATAQAEPLSRPPRQPRAATPATASPLPSASPGTEPAWDQRYDQPGEAAEFHRLKRLPEGETELPVERYLEAQEQMRRMPQYSTVEGRPLPSRGELRQEGAQAEALSAWTPLGPGNIGGRTRALLIHPTNPSVMYAAGVTGGVWKTTNGGAAWVPLADLIANIAVSSMAMDPANPDVIYAGTGEGLFVGEQDTQGDFRGAGIFKTTDGGATWTRLPATQSADFYYVNDLAVSPLNTQRLYAATRTGVWRSADGGANWTRTHSATVTGGCLDLALRTDKPTDSLFASCGSHAQATVYRNTDAGGAGAWEAVYTEGGMGRTSLALAPSNQNVIYAAAASIAGGNFSSGLHAVLRSTSGGDPGTWTAQVRNTDPIKLNTLLFSNPRSASRIECGTGASNSFFNQGWYDNVIAVDPADANRVWVGGIDLFRSDDGGRNWGLASYWWADGVTTATKAPQYAHADHHAIVFHPQYNGAGNQMMFVGNDGGVFRTDNARAAVATGASATCDPAGGAVTWTPLNSNYGVTQFYHGVPYPNGATYFGGTQDNGTVRGTDAAGVNGWQEIKGGDGGYVAVDPTNTNVLYAENTRLSFSKSTDGGATFGGATVGIFDLPGNWLFITPFTMDASDPRRLWIGGAYLWRTTNGAASWARASAITAGTGFVSAIAAAPTDANFVLAGMTRGEILRTSIGLTSTSTTTWAFTTPRTGYVSWLAFDPTNKNVAYATYSTFGGTHVWKSVDAGATWAGIDGSGATAIPDIPVHCLVVDPADARRLYVGTDLGVFVSTDGGANWAVENTGFANVITESLALNVVNGATQLFAFTHGRGAWRVATGTGGCNFTLSAPDQSFTANGGPGSVGMTADPNGCAWTAASNADWITVAAGAGGTGNGAVSFTVAANAGNSARTGTLTVAGRSLVVTQAGCAYTLAPAAQSFSVTGGSGSVRVTPDAGFCAWTASSSASWLTVTSGASGTGGGAVNYTVAPNTGSARSATLSIAGQSFAVTQAGCTYIISPTEKSFTETGGTGTIAVTTEAAICAWTASASAGWITINSGASGAGSGSVAFTVASNSGPARTGTISVAGRAFTVTQATFPDFAAPTVTITAPTAAGTFTTTGGSINLGGTAADNFAVAQVTWANDRGGSGTASGTGSWTVSALPLLSGVNNITVTARDAVGNVGSATLVVTSTPPSVIITVAGNGNLGFGGDGGPATATSLHYPHGLVIDGAGNLFVCDAGNHRIRKVTPGGVISTVAGTGSGGFGGDGGPATAARLNNPEGLAIDGAGNLYINDSFNHRIRKITASTGMISTVAGSGVSGFGGDGGPATAAQLSYPGDVQVDGAGNLYIADSINNRVRKVTAGTGVITTVVGTGAGGLSGDGGAATSAQLNFPQGLALDTAGNIYIAERDNDRVRKVTVSTGVITTFAGTYGGFGGDGGAATAAQLQDPYGLAFDQAGNLYIADELNHRIRRVAAGTSIITTVAGSGATGFGGSGFAGDGGAPTAALLRFPYAVTLDSAGNLYIADTLNNRVRKIVAIPPGTPVPSLTGLSPDAATVGGAGLTLTINGTDFNSNSVVWWNGAGRTTTFVSGTALTAALTAADIATAGAARITVFNPVPGGGASNSLTFAVNNPVPAITSLNPTSALPGGPAFTLTVNGAGFVSGAKVRWNGAERATTFVSSARLTAAIPAADIAAAGTAAVTVFNPAPGGGASAALNFTINQPCSYSISPTSQSFASAGGAGGVTVTTSGGCAWTAVANASWLTVTAGASASGGGSVNYAVAANGTTAPRSGTLTVAGQTFTVNQAGVVCPTVAGLSPATGSAGTGVTITGANLSGVTGVKFAGGHAATFVVNSDSQLTATVPSGAATGALTLSRPGCADLLTPLFTVGPGPSVVAVSGRQLIVQRRNADGTLGPPQPYVIRAVNWSPASKETNTSPADPNNAAVRRPEFAKWAAGDIPLMKAMNVNTVRLFIDPGFDAGGWAVLDELYRQGILVIMTVDHAVNDTTRAQQVVNFFKAHPAVLMWSLGNEWNINRYYGVASSVPDAARRTEAAAALLKPLDANHPVAASYGEIDIGADGLRLADTERYVNTVCPSVDVWGLNIYRGHTFGSLFTQWAAVSGKPMFIGEFGTDAFRSASPTNPPPGAVDEAMQEQWALSLWNDLARNLSAGDANKAALGGCVFEWNDEWWKVSPAGSQQTGGFALAGGHPDGFANEEYFGVVDIERKPRRVYDALKAAFDPAYQPPACAYAAAPASQSIESAGGAGSVAITAPGGCAWTATSSAAWLTITAGASGSGGGAVSYQVAANPTTGARTTTLTVAGQAVTVTQAALVTSVSAASYNPDRVLASESIASAFGTGLATATQSAAGFPLPTALAGTTVRVRDAAGVTRDAPLFFVSPTQINYLIPAGTGNGTATVSITGGGNWATGTVEIMTVAPSLFAANADGREVAAGLVQRHRVGSTTPVYEGIVRIDPATGRLAALPIDLGPEGERVFLELYGTGIRFRSSLPNVQVRIGGVSLEALYAGAAPGFVGLDQVNVELPRSLIGRGEVDVVLTVDGRAANTVRISVK